ncbi:outer membrane beta-barrel protein [Labilibaculum sp. A4]|uniref:outer membrane beta-barrel protein n=1 Tax=Labilibaculum euxinus TaxID=2686357 RepID=UPI001365BD8A|nr:outer membrane beta-barrel protein [Labilibaculum euxinus]MDQ1771759.1 outer membrane beta-barrel protein [Labilibaculum euxinus]MWN77252.1 outer membrane beta-barrel protein [Labilibaculum euxinus]
MKKIFLLCMAFVLVFGSNAQEVADTLKTDTIKKKILIEDSWSNQKKKSEKKETVKTQSWETTADTTKVKFLEKDLVKVVEDDKGIKAKIGKIGKVGFEEDRDTTKIRLGGKQINIIDGWHGTRIRIQKVNPWDANQDKFFLEEEKGFRGHWAGFEVGVNGFADEYYGDYLDDQKDFMDLDMAKSLAVNLNFLQYDISLQKERNTIGLVTGMGLEWNNYRFDQNITLANDGSGKIEPIAFDPDWNIKKSKLTSLYLTVPLLLEFQIPVKYKSRRVHMSAGLVGGLRIGSHTKVKYKSNGNMHKDKDHDDFNLNTLRCAAHARIGYRSLNFFATYGLTDLFEYNKGPELVPFTVGITLVSF